VRHKFFLFFFIFFFSHTVFADYDPGDLIDSAKRSKSIMEVFLERWEKLYQSPKGEERYQHSYIKQDKVLKKDLYQNLEKGEFVQCVDLYFNQETILDFSVRTPFGVSNMNLRKRYGVFIFQFLDIEEPDLHFVFSLSGARYGLYKEFDLSGSSQIEDGFPDNSSMTDTFFTQIYDDLVLFSVYSKPWFVVHAGIFINEEVDPVNGIIGDGNDINRKLKSRFMFHAEAGGFLFSRFIFNSETSEAETLNEKINFSSLLALAGYPLWKKTFPELALGYALSRSTVSQYAFFEKIRPKQTLFLETETDLFPFTLRNKFSFFLESEKKADQNKIVDQIIVEADYILGNPSPLMKKNEQSIFSYYFIFSFGASYFNSSRSLSFGNDESGMTGFMLGFRFLWSWEYLGLSFDFHYYYNYASKLETLIESVDKSDYEFSVSLSY